MTRVRKQQPQFHLSRKGVMGLVAFVILSFILLLLSNKLSDSARFPIKVVNIVGAKHIDHEAMQQSLAPLVSGGYFGVDVENIKERLLKISWISEVSVRRIWPDQVFVQITEKKPVARWNENSLLSSVGDLFIPETGTSPGDLPHFYGPEGKQIFMMQYYEKMNQILMPLHYKVARLEWTPAHLWNVTLDNGMKLTIGHKDFLTRFSHFVKVYPKIIGNRAADIDYVDLRYSNGLAVRWKSETQNV